MKPPSTIVSEDTIAPVIPTIACKKAKLLIDFIHFTLLNYVRDLELVVFLRCFNFKYFIFLILFISTNFGIN